MTQWSLKSHRNFAGVPGPVTLVVMDGVGIGRQDAGDAVWLARTPNLDWLSKNTLSRSLRAHGRSVGLPSDNDMGNSEVGHNALGSGRVFEQGAAQVGHALASGDLFSGSLWSDLVSRVIASGEPLHFLGLLSDGNVHSHIDHLFAMLHRCHTDGVPKARVHVLLDGRDVPDGSALDYIDRLEVELRKLCDAGRDYRIASGGGRMHITMDRYGAEWDMVERGWKAHVHGDARAFGSAREAIETFREEEAGRSDQFLPAFAVKDAEGEPVGKIRDGSAVVLFNFRGDRALEITRAFEEETFTEFARGSRPDVLFAGLMQYDGDLLLPSRFLVAPPNIDEVLGEYMVRNDVSLLACSETQKYGHVTYFWNGNRGGYIDESRETYVEVPSETLPFEERPWMKAAEITDRVLAELASGEFRHARVNYANGDMVGHTGDRDATIMAVEAVDLCLGRLMAFTKASRGALIVTADHGNADEMYQRVKGTGEPLLDAAGDPKSRTSHSLNPVPFSIYAPACTDLSLRKSDLAEAGLANVAATTLHLCGLEAPADYAPSLLET